MRSENLQDLQCNLLDSPATLKTLKHPQKPLDVSRIL